MALPVSAIVETPELFFSAISIPSTSNQSVNSVYSSAYSPTFSSFSKPFSTFQVTRFILLLLLLLLQCSPAPC